MYKNVCLKYKLKIFGTRPNCDRIQLFVDNYLQYSRVFSKFKRLLQITFSSGFFEIFVDYIYILNDIIIILVQYTYKDHWRKLCGLVWKTYIFKTLVVYVSSEKLVKTERVSKLNWWRISLLTMCVYFWSPVLMTKLLQGLQQNKFLNY